MAFEYGISSMQPELKMCIMLHPPTPIGVSIKSQATVIVNNNKTY